MKLPELHSALAPAMQALIGHRQALGYRDKNIISHLWNFDRYLVHSGQTEPFLTRRAAEEWAARQCRWPFPDALRVASHHSHARCPSRCFHGVAAGQENQPSHLPTHDRSSSDPGWCGTKRRTQLAWSREHGNYTCLRGNRHADETRSARREWSPEGVGEKLSLVKTEPVNLA